MTLHASTSLEEPLPLPLLENWEHWVEKLSEELEPFLPEWNISDDDEALLAWRGSPEALVTFDTQGNTFLQQVSLKSWQGITLPRQWDHPDKRDPGPGEQLYQFATKIKQALGIWQNSLLELIESHEP